MGAGLLFSQVTSCADFSPFLFFPHPPVRFNRITDLGKVLAGIQVPPTESADFDGFLQTLGYPYVEETENEVYKRYLRG